MKTGMNSGSFAYLPLDRMYVRMRELGYDAVDQDLANTKATCYRDRTAMEEHCKAVREAAENAGLSISQVHGPWPTDDTTAENRVKTL